MNILINITAISETFIENMITFVLKHEQSENQTKMYYEMEDILIKERLETLYLLCINNEERPTPAQLVSYITHQN
jgi:hypothetical protein